MGIVKVYKLWFMLPDLGYWDRVMTRQELVGCWKKNRQTAGAVVAGIKGIEAGNQDVFEHHFYNSETHEIYWVWITKVWKRLRVFCG